MSKKKNEKLAQEVEPSENIVEVNPTQEPVENVDLTQPIEPVENTDIDGDINSTEGADEPVENVEEKDLDKSEEKEEPKEEMVTLKIEKKFKDKYDNSIHYEKGKEYEFKAERAEELLNDKRNLVSKVK